MYATSNWNAELLRLTRQAFLVTGMIAATSLATSSLAVAQSTMPDAQVEANVLKALAAAPELANQSITTRTVYGTVTLSGSVTTESARTKAETLAANAAGVKKVIDELQLGTGGQQTAQSNADQAAPMVLQSDGTYAPAPQVDVPNQAANPAPGSAPAAMAQRNNPDADQALDQQMQPPASGQTAQNQPQQYPNQQPQQYPNQQYPNQPNTTANNQQPYPPQPYGRRPMYNPAYPYGYPPQSQQPQPGAYAQQPQQPYGQQPYVGGQEAGQNVTIPSGALLRVRLNRTLSSNHTPPGTTFDGIVVNDVVADGLVAIPRGASVQGKVVDAKSSGALKGRGEMSIQLTQVTLGGKVYPITSDLWDHNGGDKTIESINKTAGFGALGAILGAVAGGGEGAAIGGGIGAAAGLGSSAASGRGQVVLPAEAIIVFHTAAPAQVATVSEQEMQRLAYGVPAAGEQRALRRNYRVYPGYYPPPVYPAYGYPAY